MLFRSDWNKVLSSRSLERREKMDITPDFTDLPINNEYLLTLEENGFKVLNRSKWLNTVVVDVEATDDIPRLRDLPFVDSLKIVWRDAVQTKALFSKNMPVAVVDAGSTSLPFKQLEIHNGDLMHKQGWKGDGIIIGVLDAGFKNTDMIDAINQNVIAIKNIAEPDGNLYKADNHGTNVLSVMSHLETDTFCGTAPEAQYVLIRTEYAPTEFPIEEDYWIEGAEYADSIGVDIITSSLGYYWFDDESANYSEDDIDGKTAFVTKAAGIGFSKGIMMINSAGNERLNAWERIIFPADHPDVLAVGGIKRDFSDAYFTSVGFVKDGYVKPDVCAVGVATYLIGDNGRLMTADGTSFAAPVIAGLTACLMQALPDKSNREILDLIRKSSQNYGNPDDLKGYGIPDFYSIYNLSTSVDNFEREDEIKLTNLDGGLFWEVLTGENQGESTVTVQIGRASSRERVLRLV